MASRISLFHYFLKEYDKIYKKYKIKSYYNNDTCIIDLLEYKLRIIYKYPYRTPNFYIYSNKNQILYNQHLCKIFIIYNLKKTNHNLPINILCDRTIISEKKNIIKTIDRILNTKNILCNLYIAYLGHKIFDKLGLHFYPIHEWLI